MSEVGERKDFGVFVAGLDIEKFDESQIARIKSFLELSELERVNLMGELLSQNLITNEEAGELNNFHLAINDFKGMQELETIVRETDADPKLVEQFDRHVAGAVGRMEFLPPEYETRFKLTPNILFELFTLNPSLKDRLLPYINNDGVVDARALNVAAQNGDFNREELEFIVHSASEVGAELVGGRDKKAYERVMTGDYSLESLMGELAEAERRIEELRGGKAKVEVELDDLRGVLANVNSDLKTEKGSREKLERDLEDLQQEYKTYKGTHRYIGDEVARVESELEATKANLQEKDGKINSLEQSLEGLKSNALSLEKDNKRTLADLEKVRGEYSELFAASEDRKAKLNSTQLESDRLRANLAEIKGVLDSKETEYETALAGLEELRQQNIEDGNRLRAIIAGNETRIEELDSELDGVKGEKNRLEEIVIGIRAEKERLEQEHGEYVEGHKVTDEEARKREELLKEKLANVNDARSEAERRLSEQIAEHQGLEIRLNVKDDELRIVRGTLDKLKDILEQDKTRNNEMVGYLSRELLKTRKALLEITEDNQTLVSALDEFERSLPLTVEGVVSGHLEDLGLNELREKVEGLLVSVDNYMGRVDEERRELNTALAELQREKNRLVGELEASDNTKAGLQRQLDEGKGRVIELEKKVLQAEAEKGLSEEEANRLIGSAVDRTAERFGKDYGSLLTKLGELRDAFLGFENGTDRDLKGIDGKVGNVFKNLLSLTTEDGLLTQINNGLGELKKAYEEGKTDEGKIREILTPQLGQLDSLYTRLRGVAAQLEKSSGSRDEETLRQLGLVKETLFHLDQLKGDINKVVGACAESGREIKKEADRIKEAADGIEGFADNVLGTYKSLERFAVRKFRSLRSLSRNLWSNRVYSLISLGVVSFGLAAGYFVAMRYTKASDTMVASAGRMAKEHHDFIEDDKKVNDEILARTEKALDDATKNYGGKLNTVADNTISKLNEGVNGLGSKLEEAGNKSLAFVGEFDSGLNKTLGNTESRLELVVDNLEDKGNDAFDRLNVLGSYLENTEKGIGEKAVQLGETVDLLGVQAEDGKKYLEGLNAKVQDSGKVTEILDRVDKSLNEQKGTLKSIEEKVDGLPSKQGIIDGVGQRVDENNKLLITNIEAVKISVDNNGKIIIGEVKAIETRLTGEINRNNGLVITSITAVGDKVEVQRDYIGNVKEELVGVIGNLEKAINGYAGISQEERANVLNEFTGLINYLAGLDSRIGVEEGQSVYAVLREVNRRTGEIDKGLRILSEGVEGSSEDIYKIRERIGLLAAGEFLKTVGSTEYAYVVRTGGTFRQGFEEGVREMLMKKRTELTDNRKIVSDLDFVLSDGGDETFYEIVDTLEEGLPRRDGKILFLQEVNGKKVEVLVDPDDKLPIGTAIPIPGYTSKR